MRRYIMVSKTRICIGFAFLIGTGSMYVVALAFPSPAVAVGVSPIANRRIGSVLVSSPVTGGHSFAGTVNLLDPAPAGGTTVSLVSSNTAVASVPAAVTVAA